MFETYNRPKRQGGYRQDVSPRRQSDASDFGNAESIHKRPRFNPNQSYHTPRVHFNDDEMHSERMDRRSTTTHTAPYNMGVQRDANRENGYKSRNGYRDARDGYRDSRNNSNNESRPRIKRSESVYGKQKQFEYKQKYEDPTKPIRLNKYLANAGICSRREADDFIQAGVISVNGVIVSELGVKVLPTDKVMFHNQPVSREQKVYLLLNKPKNTVTTTDDPEERHTVIDIVRNACSERIYPVGRLDRNTTGVLLLTNDGDLAAKLTHPKYGKRKVYAVTLDRDLEAADEEIIRSGIELDGDKIIPDAFEFTKDDRKHIGLEIHSGQNRVVRRIFERVGYKVVQLDRTSFAGLTKKNVPRGHYRFLTPKEVSMLQMGAFE